MRKLVIASHNKGKVKEIAELLKDFELEVISAGDLDLPEPVEDKDTFIGNAEIKSIAASSASGFEALSDDSGLVVPLLDGQPGVLSARWGGKDKDFDLAMNRVERELKQRGLDPNDNVIGYFVCALSWAMPDGTTQNFEGRVYGKLQFPPKGEHGFGYDAIFVPDDDEVNPERKTFAELEPEQKAKISHRTNAFKKFLRAFK